jgi:hypothetical protein
MTKKINKKITTEVEEGEILFISEDILLQEVNLRFVSHESKNGYVFEIVFNKAYIENYNRTTFYKIEFNNEKGIYKIKFKGYSGDEVNISCENLTCLEIET